MGYYSDTHRVTHYPDVLAENAANEVTLFKNTGDTAKGFMAMHKDAVADGAIDSKTKELMALAVSIAIRCEGCITSHTDSAIKKGATEQEIIETIKVGMMMSGGPGMIYGSKAIAAAEQFFGKHLA
ncbi:carboxymuconolactone decarboxylase family protein [Limosilactobacillus pontis]|nr:carboxymuconolactone decarboxylase family protein [Limosilactobacillus pontis]QFV00964.1 carboxymuconolactone decarboxylase family protein [Limosilactobacillus pontis]